MRSYVLLECGMRSVEWGVVFYQNVTNGECGVMSYVLLECGMRSVECGVVFYWNVE